MATPARVRITCKTPSVISTEVSTPILRVNSPYLRSVQRVVGLPVNDDAAERLRRRQEAAAASPAANTPTIRRDVEM